MFRYLYLVFLNRYQNKLKGLFKYFSLYNGQFYDSCKDEGVIFPAIAVEFVPIKHTYLPGRILDSEMNVIFHVVDETQGSTRSKDLASGTTAKHFDLITPVHIAFNNFRTDLGLIPSGLTIDQNYYSFGAMNRLSVEKCND